MKVTIDREKCTGCNTCLEKCCGAGFIVGILSQKARWFEDGCIDCMACTEPDFCPHGAITVEE